MAEEAQKQVDVVVTDVLEVVEDEKKNTTTYTSLSTDSTTIEDYSSPKKEEEDGDEEEEVTSGVKFGGNNNATDEICTENDGNNELFPDNEMKALVELKLLIRTSINNNEFTCSPPPPSSESIVKQEQTTTAETTLQESSAAETLQELSAESSRPVVTEQQDVKTIMCDNAHQLLTPLSEEGVSIWGVPLFKDQRTDTVLWKFLHARDFKVQDAFTMFKSTIKWRKEFKIDELISEEDELCKDLEKVVFMHGVSKEGHPVCYNVYGAFENKELYQRTFSDEEKRQRFLKWRIQVLEKSIRKLDFWGGCGGVCTIVQVNDLKNSPGPGKWELRQATKQALHLLQDNYPEFVAKQVFINVPWWYVAVNKMISPFLTQRTKSKFVVAGPSKSAETLFSYIAPEQIPVQYGGFSKQGEFGTKDGVTQIFVKPNSKETVEFAVTEACHLTWEMRVLGWEVSYGAEFVPNAKDAYTVIIQKMRKVGAAEETVISNTFKTSERGIVVLTIDNSSSKKKRLLYRIKSHPSNP